MHIFRLASFSFFLIQTITCFSQAEYSIEIKKMKQIAKVDERFQSYNIEMCEVIGGDFWIPYNLIDSVRKTTKKSGIAALKWKIEPINLYEKKLRNLASALGPSYIRVSGTWANSVYFQDKDDSPTTTIPDGFKNLLTRKQWKGVVDFTKAVNGQLVSSFPISNGIRDQHGNWTEKAIKPLMDYTHYLGGEIVAAEMFNEPSHASHGDAPKGYNAEQFAKDFNLFKHFVRKEYPKMKILGPGSTGEGGIIPSQDIFVDKILSADPNPEFDIFTYHYYGTVSKRCGGSQTVEKAMTPDWFQKTEKGLAFYQHIKDKYMPNVPIWNTETAESACGGNPMASTYVDTFRYIEQLGRLAKKNVQVVMHNTLARSEYALLDEDTHNPRPNYWAALLWGKLMGSEVYEAGEYDGGLDIFVHRLKGSQKGRALVFVNASGEEKQIEMPAEGKLYVLTSDELVSKKINLNGKVLKLNSDDTVPQLKGVKVNKGKLKLPAFSVTFASFDHI